MVQNIFSLPTSLNHAEIFPSLFSFPFSCTQFEFALLTFHDAEAITYQSTDFCMFQCL